MPGASHASPSTRCTLSNAAQKAGGAQRRGRRWRHSFSGRRGADRGGLTLQIGNAFVQCGQECCKFLHRLRMRAPRLLLEPLCDRVARSLMLRDPTMTWVE